MLKTISSITNALGALNYKGTWNALTNSPTLADGTGAKGDYYVTSTAGTQTFGGLLLFFGVGDWIVYNGAVWQRVEGGSDGNFANITLNSTDAGASAAPLLDLYRDSASPAASDTLGEIEFNGEDSAGNKQQYALIHASILSPTSGAESGQLHFETATGGASTEKMIIGTTNLVINEIGAVFNVRIEGDTDANLLFTDATNDRVGVGTISPSVKFEVNGAAKASSLSLTTPLPATSGGSGSSSAFTANAVVYASSSTVLATGSELQFDGNNLIIGATSQLFSGKLGIKFNGNGTNGISLQTTFAGPGDAYLNFIDQAGTQIGYIYRPTTTTVALVSTSDQRLKTNIADAASGLDKLANVKIRSFNWDKDGSFVDFGIIAQELNEVAPECVRIGSDDLTEDGNLKNPWSAQPYVLVPAMIKAIQELSDQVTTLKARLDAANIA